MDRSTIARARSTLRSCAGASRGGCRPPEVRCCERCPAAGLLSPRHDRRPAPRAAPRAGAAALRRLRRAARGVLAARARAARFAILGRVNEIDLVASAGALDNVVVALREFIHRSGALRVVAVTPDSMVDCPRLAPIEVTTQGSTVALPHAIELDVDDPIAVPTFASRRRSRSTPRRSRFARRSACCRGWATRCARWRRRSGRMSS